MNISTDDRIPPEPDKKNPEEGPGAIKLVIGLCIALVVLVIVFIAVAVIGGMNYSSHLSTGYSEYFDDDDDDEYDYNYDSDGDYEPDKSRYLLRRDHRCHHCGLKL